MFLNNVGPTCFRVMSSTHQLTTLSPVATFKIDFGLFVCAGFVACSATNPIWFVKTRLQLDNASGSRQLTAGQVIRSIYRQSVGTLLKTFYCCGRGNGCAFLRSLLLITLLSFVDFNLIHRSNFDLLILQTVNSIIELELLPWLTGFSTEQACADNLLPRLKRLLYLFIVLYIDQATAIPCVKHSLLLSDKWIMLAFF